MKIFMLFTPDNWKVRYGPGDTNVPPITRHLQIGPLSFVWFVVARIGRGDRAPTG